MKSHDVTECTDKAILEKAILDAMIRFFFRAAEKALAVAVQRAAGPQAPAGPPTPNVTPPSPGGPASKE